MSAGRRVRRAPVSTTAVRTEVHIDELVVRGVDVGRGPAFGDAVVEALTRIVGTRGLDPDPATAGAPVTAPLEWGAAPEELAEGVADAVWRSLAAEDRR